MSSKTMDFIKTRGQNIMNVHINWLGSPINFFKWGSSINLF